MSFGLLDPVELLVDHPDQTPLLVEPLEPLLPPVPGVPVPYCSPPFPGDPAVAETVAVDEIIKFAWLFA